MTVLAWDATPLVEGRPPIEPPCPRCEMQILDRAMCIVGPDLDRFGVKVFRHLMCPR